MELTIIENAVSKGYQDAIEADFSSHLFPWYFHDGITQENSDDNSGFSNLVFEGNYKSDYYAFLYPVLLEALGKYKKGLSITKLFRIRAAMFVKNQTSALHNVPHIDHQYKHYTMLYYVNDSDGPTRFFSNEEIVKEVEPKKGRVVLFNGDTYHASSSPRNHTRRMVINYNFLL